MAFQAMSVHCLLSSKSSGKWLVIPNVTGYQPWVVQRGTSSIASLDQRCSIIFRDQFQENTRKEFSASLLWARVLLPNLLKSLALCR